MKRTTQKIASKKDKRRQFIQKFKNQVKDSSSIERLRISKIHESSYKIYNTIWQSPKYKNSKVTILQGKIKLFPRGLNQDHQDNFSLAESKPQQRYNQCLKAYNDLQKELQAKLEGYYTVIKERVDKIQKWYESLNERNSQIEKLQQFSQRVSIIHTIFTSTLRLKQIYGFQLQAQSINTILKSLLERIEKSHQGKNINRKHQSTERQKMIKHFYYKPKAQTKDFNDCEEQVCPTSALQNILKTEIDEVNSESFGPGMLSTSSFKIENENIHEQQFFNVYLSKNNSKVSLNHSKNYQLQLSQQANQFKQTVIKQEKKLSVTKPKIDIITLHNKQDKTNKTSKRTLNLAYNISTLIAKTQAQEKKRLKSDQSSLCKLLKCQQITKLSESEVEESQSKRQVLNEIISLLNNKYNKCIKFQ